MRKFCPCPPWHLGEASWRCGAPNDKMNKHARMFKKNWSRLSQRSSAQQPWSTNQVATDEREAMTDARHWAFFFFEHTDGLLNGLFRRAAEQVESPGYPFKCDTVELPSHVDPQVPRRISFTKKSRKQQRHTTQNNSKPKHPIRHSKSQGRTFLVTTLRLLQTSVVDAIRTCNPALTSWALFQQSLPACPGCRRPTVRTPSSLRRPRTPRQA